MGVIISKHGTVVEVVLDWPEQRNALGPVEGRELRVAIEEVASDDDTSVLVMSATGKAFCAGGDLPEILRLAQGGADAVRSAVYGEFQGIFRALATSPVPVIVAVDGPAVGFGCDLALAGSATCIGSRGWLAQGWARAGLIPATGGTLYAKRRGGAQVIWRLLSAQRVDGPTAEKWGLGIASEIGRDAALEMAEAIAALPGPAVRALTQLARIDEPEQHLARALDYQIGFLTDPNFAGRVAKLLGR